MDDAAGAASTRELDLDDLPTLDSDPEAERGASGRAEPDATRQQGLRSEPSPPLPPFPYPPGTEPPNPSAPVLSLPVHAVCSGQPQLAFDTFLRRQAAALFVDPDDPMRLSANDVRDAFKIIDENLSRLLEKHPDLNPQLLEIQQVVEDDEIDESVARNLVRLAEKAVTLPDQERVPALEVLRLVASGQGLGGLNLDFVADLLNLPPSARSLALDAVREGMTFRPSQRTALLSILREVKDLPNSESQMQALDLLRDILRLSARDQSAALRRLLDVLQGYARGRPPEEVELGLVAIRILLDNPQRTNWGP